MAEERKVVRDAKVLEEVDKLVDEEVDGNDPVVLKARGVEVNGGGNGAPLGSPFTLLFNAGSSGITALPFFPVGFPSL